MGICKYVTGKSLVFFWFGSTLRTCVDWSRFFFFIKCVLVLDQGFLSKQFWSIPEWRTPDYFPPMKNTQDEPPSRTALVKASAKKQPLDLPAPEGTLFLPKIRPLWVPENHRWHSCGTHYGQSFSIGSIKSTFWKIYPLVNVYSLRTWKWPSRNSWFTHCSNGGSFHSYVNVYQRVYSHEIPLNHHSTTGKRLHNYGKIHHLNNG
jgi:hypothetical protein